MSITQPSPNIILPEQIQQAIENAKNSITILKGEEKRLNRLNLSIETEITKKELYRNEIQEIIDKKSNILKKLDNDIIEVDKLLEEKRKEIKKISLMIIENDKELEIKKLSIQNSNKLLEENKNIIEKEKVMIESDKKQLQLEKKQFEEKSQKLKDLLK